MEHNRRRTKTRIWTVDYKRFSKTNEPMPKRFQKIKEMNTYAFRNYVPQYYSDRVHLFKAKDVELVKYDIAALWKGLSQCVDIVEVPGDHLTLTEEPNVQILAHILRNYLNPPKQH